MLYRFRHKIVGPLVIAWLLLTVASVYSRLLVWHEMTVSLRSTEVATLLSEDLDQLHSVLLTAESSQRAYLLTGDKSFLDSFNQAKNSLAPNFNRLANLALSDRMLQSDLLKLRGVSELKMSEMEDTIKLRDTQGQTAAAALVDTGKGRDFMEQVQKVIAHMRIQGHGLFSDAGLATRQQLQTGQNLTMLTGVLGIGAGLIALYLVRVGYLQDKSQRELLEKKVHAEKAVNEKSAFLANMSHEIRTPMNSILGFGELLEGESLTPQQTQYVRSIRQSGKSLLQLINDVLDLSKLEAGRLELHLEPTDPREICEFLRMMFTQQAAVKFLDLKFEVEAAPQALLLDRLRLRQVLVNLVGNAIKFTDGGSVKVKIKWLPNEGDRSRGTLAIDVADSGAGISLGQKEEIFKPFVQSSPRRGVENQGSGLGLHIVRRLMEMMDGAVTLESTLGKGSVFSLKLQNVSVSARLPVNDLTEQDQPTNFNDFQPATLLVVDDNSTNRSLIASMFARSHHRISMAENGKEALGLILKGKPDLVLMDIRMPLMDGRAALAEIRKIPGLELLPVIAVTASSQSADDLELRSRFSGYIRKPFSQQALYKELEQFLPRASVTGISAEKVEPPVTGMIATGKKADDWDVLTVELRVLQSREWTILCESLAINDTQIFAQKLRALAQTMQCSPLTAYADTLAAYAQTYAVTDLEKHLQDFPALVQVIEQHTRVS